MTSGNEGSSGTPEQQQEQEQQEQQEQQQPQPQEELSPSLQQLLERTKYPLVQESGQRRYGPPPGWEGPPPPKGCEVFVGKIPRDLFEDELVPVMERAGRLYEMRLMVDQTATNRGYGFVQYCSRPEAETALRSLNNYEVRPKRYLGVTRSVDNNRLFVGGIPKSRTREEVLEEMRRVTDGVVQVILYPCVNDRTKNRGYAFVEYTSHKAAAMARRRLFSGRVLLWGSAEVKVDWAEPEHSVDIEVMSTVRVLYIRNLALCTTEEDIRNLCHGATNGVQRVKKQKDYAFVHFSSRERAEAVKATLNGTLVHGCELEVTWAKPVKNREEYHQRKALARQMVSASQPSQPGYLQHFSLAGDPVMVMPQVRKAAGTHGIQHHPTHTLPTPARPLEAPLLGLPGQLFIPQDTHLKAPNELILTGYPSMGTATLPAEKMTPAPEDPRGMPQNPSPVPQAGPRLLTASQALRGPPLTPQYIMAPQFYMAPAMATATPQAIPVTSTACIYPTAAAPLTGYEGLNPYALQAAFYQQALLAQSGMAAVDRQVPRYNTTGE